MKPELKTELFRAACAAFEQVAFMMPTLAEDPDEPGTTYESVAVDIGGALAGRMVLGVSSRMLGGLAANMLGDDMPLPLDQQRDALGEVANIICGAFLPAIEGKGGVFSITPPVAADLEGERHRLLPGAPVTLRLGLDEGSAEILLWLH